MAVTGVAGERCAGVEVGQLRAQSVDAVHQVVAFDVGDVDVEPQSVGDLAHLVGAARRVQPTGVGDHLDAPLDARRRAPAPSGAGTCGVAELGVARSLLVEDEHRELGQPVAGEHVDVRPPFDHLLGGRQPVAEEPAAVGDAHRPLGPAHAGSIFGRAAGRSRAAGRPARRSRRRCPRWVRRPGAPSSSPPSSAAAVRRPRRRRRRRAGAGPCRASARRSSRRGRRRRVSAKRGEHREAELTAGDEHDVVVDLGLDEVAAPATSRRRAAAPSTEHLSSAAVSVVAVAAPHDRRLDSSAVAAGCCANRAGRSVNAVRCDRPQANAAAATKAGSVLDGGRRVAAGRASRCRSSCQSIGQPREQAEELAAVGDRPDQMAPCSGHDAAC